VQNAVVGVVNEQKQLVAQGRVALQVPPHVAELLASLRNWRAETVPAHSTAAAIVAKNALLIVRFITHLPFWTGSNI
jgi:hypothetical protein